MKKTFIFAIVAAAMLVFGPVLAQANTSPSLTEGTLWKSTEPTVNYRGYAADTSLKFALFNEVGDQIEEIAYFPGLPIIVDSITMEVNSKFRVGLYDPICDMWIGNTEPPIGGDGMYLLTWSGYTVALAQIDAQPVPIPAAVYLLGAGLLGIAGFRKRK